MNFERLGGVWDNLRCVFVNVIYELLLFIINVYFFFGIFLVINFVSDFFYFFIIY